MGNKDRKDEPWKTEEQMVGCVQEDDWWTVQKPGTNPVIVEKYTDSKTKGNICLYRTSCTDVDLQVLLPNRTPLAEWDIFLLLY